jgi:2-succinyl-5-enolpyruvyl-6-hydroxy-3-cyclohexene-1-carboxylate synthase
VRIVCIDNRGGGIFSFLPQASSLTADRFEQLFGTPHKSDIELIAKAHGISTRKVDSMESLVNQIGESGSWLFCISTNRTENVVVHERLITKVAGALAH